MRVAVVGLGSIARKAYLPVLATAGVTPVLVTRNRTTLDTVGDAYRVPDRFTSVEEAIASGLDAATVHTPSDTHPRVVRALLDAGVPTLVDKPIATSADAARVVVEQARERGVSLMVGFNRRWAPTYCELAGWADRDVVQLQKHRSEPLGAARAMVFDDFIHVLDTLRFLVPSPLDDVVVSTNVDDAGRCRRVAVHFTGDGARLALGSMSWTAGMAHETLDVIGDGRRRQVVDLSDVIDLDGGERVVRRDGWSPATELRGFRAMCDAFLEAVREGRLLDAGDALVTHELCEKVVAAAG
ncbi:MAG TPA: Gfo/Idh/MocA family oxidoreductase [Actinotalea sp.]